MVKWKFLCLTEESYNHVDGPWRVAVAGLFDNMADAYWASQDAVIERGICYDRVYLVFHINKGLDIYFLNKRMPELFKENEVSAEIPRDFHWQLFPEMLSLPSQWKKVMEEHFDYSHRKMEDLRELIIDELSKLIELEKGGAQATIPARRRRPGY